MKKKSPVQNQTWLCGESFAKGVDGFFTRRSVPRNIAIMTCAETGVIRKI